MFKAKISVIIPAYNRAETITYCLDSVCNQTFPIYEVIVVDDCSSDETVKIVNNYSRKHPFVRYVTLGKKSGAQAARNRGIREAKGYWIAFQDSDDEWAVDKLEKQVAALETVDFHPMTVVHTDAWRFDPLTGERNFWGLEKIDGGVYDDLLRSPGPLFPTIMTSKIALEKIGLLDEKIPSYQEWDTSIELAKYCRFIHIQEPLFVYHLHSGDTISKNELRNIDGYQYVVDKHRDEIIEKCGITTFNNHLFANACRAMRLGNYEKAREILIKTIGNSVHRNFLQFMARWELSPVIYDLATKAGEYCRAMEKMFMMKKRDSGAMSL